MNETPPRPRPSARFLLIAGVAALLAFLAGFGWQFVEARSARSERDALATELAFQDLATTLASAVIQAEYGSYEGARELMSRFFTRLQDHLDSAPAQAREELRAILERRDAIITGLSRGEAQSGTTLARVFVRYQTAFGELEGGLPLGGPEGTEAAPGGALPDTGRAEGPGPAGG